MPGANAAKKLSNAFLTLSRAKAQALLQHLVGRRLGLEGKPALRRSKLRRLVDKLLANARNVQRLLQGRSRLARQKLLPLTDHLGAGSQEGGIAPNILHRRRNGRLLARSQLGNLVVRRKRPRTNPACNQGLGVAEKPKTICLNRRVLALNNRLCFGHRATPPSNIRIISYMRRTPR